MALDSKIVGSGSGNGAEVDANGSAATREDVDAWIFSVVLNTAKDARRRRRVGFTRRTRHRRNIAPSAATSPAMPADRAR